MSCLTSKDQILMESPYHSVNAKVLVSGQQSAGSWCLSEHILYSCPGGPPYSRPSFPLLAPNVRCAPAQGLCSYVLSLKALLPDVCKDPSHTSSGHMQIPPSQWGLPEHLSEIAHPLLCSKSPCPSLFSSVAFHTI